MSEATFLLALKSTIDFLGTSIAQAQVPAVKFVDLGNQVNTQTLFASESDAIVWEFMTLQEAPQDPLYRVHFNIGARTVNDPGNYDILSLVGQVKVAFPVDSRINIFDYSGAVVGPLLGILNVSSISVMEQAYD